jgi:hypothetical protein
MFQGGFPELVIFQDGFPELVMFPAEKQAEISFKLSPQQCSQTTV